MVPPALSVSSGVSTSPTAFATLTARALHQLPPSPPHPTPPPLLAAGRAFLEAMREHPGLAARCRAKRIVMMVSNRFDWGLAGKRDYYSAVQASIDNATNFVWAVNNPFEQVGVKVVCGVGEQVWHLFCSTHRARLVSLGVGSPLHPPPPALPQHYMERRGIQLPGPLPLLRPQGSLPSSFAFGDAGGLPDPDPALPVVVPRKGVWWFAGVLLPGLRATGITFALEAHSHYGGPQRIARYKCLIQLPYQVRVPPDCLRMQCRAGGPLPRPWPCSVCALPAVAGDAPLLSTPLPPSRRCILAGIHHGHVREYCGWGRLFSTLASDDGTLGAWAAAGGDRRAHLCIPRRLALPPPWRGSLPPARLQQLAARRRPRLPLAPCRMVSR